MSASLTLERLSELASESGLYETSATDASPFPELIPWLEAYAERGLTGFEADRIEDRIAPTRWMPEAQSIIVTAIPYATETSEHTARRHPVGRHFGSVSRYVYGRDYHQVVQERLERLHHRLEAELRRPIQHKLAVDTSPLVDRRVAERAGLGWIGRNGMFYSERYGSYVFLGSMLVDVPIESKNPDQPHVGKHCGTCANCLIACPTGAIIAPGVIDAKRCLSYITQMKGVIPKQFRERMGRRVWGCDICQTVCPENRQKDSSPESAFYPDRELAYPDLVRLLHLSNRAFLRLYGHTAMAWRGSHTLKRNAIIALGNVGHSEAVSELIPFLKHHRAELRASAAWALGKIGGSMALQALQEASVTEENAGVLQELTEGAEMCDGHG